MNGSDQGDSSQTFEHQEIEAFEKWIEVRKVSLQLGRVVSEFLRMFLQQLYGRNGREDILDSLLQPIK